MRHHAGNPVGWLVVAASILMFDCTRTWVLPGDQVDGAAPMDANTTGTGGTSGRGGTPGAGGRAQGGASGLGGQMGTRCPAPQEKVTVQFLTTDLVFVVARNQSMATPLGNTTRMGAVQSVLHNLIQSHQNAVRFGYAEFPSYGCPNPNSCCASYFDAYVGTSSKNALPIDMALDVGMSPSVADSDFRPLAQTLRAVPTLWGAQPKDPTVVIILDGPPGCPFEDFTESCQYALNAASMLGSFPTKTYVVALGAEAQADPCLQKLATRGGTQTGLIPIPETGNADPIWALKESLGSIISQAEAKSCTIELNEQPAKMGLVSIYINGIEVNYNSSDKVEKGGWNYEKGSNLRIQLLGSSCQMLQNARESEVWARYGCVPCGEMFPCP